MKVFGKAIVVLVLLALAAGSCFGAETNWRFTIRADNNVNAYISDAQIGMFSTSSDAYDSQDRFATFLPDPSGYTMGAWCVGIVPGRTEAFMNDIKDDLAGAPATYKSWDLRVFALKDATYSNIRLRFVAVNTSTTFLPPASINGVALNAGLPNQYRLTMVNNRGVAGAPANGTQWLIPVPTVASPTVPFFSLVMPTGYGTGSDVIPNANADFAGVGYVMKYELGVPEPSGMLALGSGLTGLLGFLIRRRRK